MALYFEAKLSEYLKKTVRFSGKGTKMVSFCV